MANEGDRAGVLSETRQSEAQLRSILLTAPDVIMAVDRAGTILFINRTVLPLRPEQVIGTCSFDHVLPEARPRVVAAIDHARRGHQLSAQALLAVDARERGPRRPRQMS